jgi:hypothetical protein
MLLEVNSPSFPFLDDGAAGGRLLFDYRVADVQSSHADFVQLFLNEIVGVHGKYFDTPVVD